MRRKIIIAEPRGFCAGVERAVKMAELALNDPRPLYLLHDIVHNDLVMNGLIRKGAKMAACPDDIPEGARLLISAHGDGKNIWRSAEKRGLTVIDATCPLVRQVQKKAADLTDAGYNVLLCGDPGHREICGIIGQNGAPDKITVLKNMDDAEQFQPELGCRYALLSQTTWDSEQLAEMIASLQRRIPDLNVCGNVCHATNDRQNAVRTLAEQADVILIAGSPSSSNTLRLREIAERSCGRAFLIAGAGDLTAEMICGAEVVGIASGASAPESLVRGIAAAVENLP